jgi:DNA (cytosine-5)-methyltransferase 1
MKRSAKPRVAELFAGVGGFRLGLEKAGWEVKYSNQWEPGTNRQHASEVYVANFGAEGHSNLDIAKVKRIPCKFELLVGGFPCQDYSVAKSLTSAHGIKGKKGVLWWEILRLVKIHKPRFVLLENVERLLKSPANQRGRDFAIMLRSLGDAGYVVEWRVINAADYGFPQKRLRIFILARRSSSKKVVNPSNHILKESAFAKSLPVSSTVKNYCELKIAKDLTKLSQTFNKGEGKSSPFRNAGIYCNGIAYTMEVEVDSRKIGKVNTLRNVVISEKLVDENYFIPKSQIRIWRYQKGAKSVKRQNKKTGFVYNYSEGSIAFPDLLTNPSRTILTGEGGSSPSRFKHVIKTSKGFRRLTPVELERLNGFPDDWTKLDCHGNLITDTRRAFLMGNALVVGIVERIGKQLKKELSK